MLILYGGNGFIGRHIAVAAHRRGIPCATVTPTPNPGFISEYAPSVRLISVEEFADKAGERLLLNASAFVHLASRSVPITNVERPAQELSEDVEPAFEVFLRVGKVRPELPIVFLSSGGSVYGRTTLARIPEAEPPKPISPYALGKVLLEQCLAYCGDTAGQNYTVLRVSNPIGRWHRNPRQGIVMAALRALEADEPLEVFGDGRTVRDYIDADDLADAILRVAQSGRVSRDVFNVGSGVGHDVLGVIETVADVFGRTPRIVHRPARSIDVPRSVLDPTRFETAFGWRATTSLRESVEKIVLARAEDRRSAAGGQDGTTKPISR